MTRILIAEDEERISAFVAKGLEAAGYQTLIVDDGAEALDTALSGEVDLVLLDVGLPSLDGFEVLRSLRGQGSTLPVIMLTEARERTVERQGLESGADAYISKSAEQELIVLRIKALLRRASSSATACWCATRTTATPAWPSRPRACPNEAGPARPG